MNQSDEIVGFDEVGNLARYWRTPVAAPIALLPLPGHTNSRAYAINDDGIVIGSS